MSIQLCGPGIDINVDIHLYSDNTPYVKIEEFEAVAKDIRQIVVKADTMNTFVTSMILANSLNRMRLITWQLELVLPYIPGARQDRINPTGDVLNTAAWVAQVINAGEFRNIKVLDPHSDIIANLLYNVDVLETGWVLENHWKGYTGIIAPDKGAKNRAESAAQALGKEVTYGTKVRDVSTGKLSGFAIDLAPGGHYLVVDDICDGGGTFLGLGEKIKEAGCFADLYVTHGIFSKGVAPLHKFYKNVFTTDSINGNHQGAYIIPVIERMKNA